jgi:hypothetical protein
MILLSLARQKGRRLAALCSRSGIAEADYNSFLLYGKYDHGLRRRTTRAMIVNTSSATTTTTITIKSVLARVGAADWD